MSIHWPGSRLAGKWLFGVLFVLAGVNHFRSPDTYMKIMPPYLPAHRPLVLLSGAFEIALGALLLVPQVSWLAAWGLIALLIPGEYLPVPAPGNPPVVLASNPSAAAAVTGRLDLVGLALHQTRLIHRDSV
jgi:DoxX